MTRWARGGPANKKKPHSGSKWQELKADQQPKVGKVEDLSSAKSPKAKNKDELHCTIQMDKKKKSNAKKVCKNVDQALKEESQTDKCSGMAASNNDVFIPPWQKEDAAKDVGLAAALEDLMAEGEEEELADMMHKDQRREDRRQKRILMRNMGKTCFNCRKPGHDISVCPDMLKNMAFGTGICYKCGSTEHHVNDCRKKVPGGHLPYAKCFICNETGHLAKQCPDNPRGLYPKGGCCRMCGSVEHYKKDCPEHMKKQGVEGMTLGRLSASGSVDDELSLHRAKHTAVKRKTKIVKF